MTTEKGWRPAAKNKREAKKIVNHLNDWTPNPKWERKLVSINDTLVYRPSQYNVQYPKMLESRGEWAHYETIINKVNGKPERIWNDFPTLQGFLSEHKIPRTTFREWTKKFPELAQALSVFKEQQADFLIQNGLNGTYNPTIVKFVGANELWMVDKKEVITTNSEINNEQRTKIITEYLSSLPDWGKVEVLDDKVEDNG